MRASLPRFVGSVERGRGCLRRKEKGMQEFRKGVAVLAAVTLGLAFAGQVYAQAAPKKGDGAAVDMKQVERGRYVSMMAGCNDCHTPGYLLSEGKVPESLWLTGDKFGWRGPWGTTYPANLRVLINAMTEEEWLTTARNLKTRPPMPWFDLNQMQDEDLRVLYHFVRYLGSAGEAAPAYVPPGQEPKTPYALFPSPPQK
jgi:hypothetical protein